MRLIGRLWRFLHYRSGFPKGMINPMRGLVFCLTLALPAIATGKPKPPTLEGMWEVVSMQCAGKEVPKKITQSYTKPNSIHFRFHDKTATSVWKSGKCTYQLTYAAEVTGPGKLTGSLTGPPVCKPQNCHPQLCGTSLPKIAMTYGYAIKKKHLTVTSPTGLECITQGLAAPAEFHFRKIKG